MKTISRNAFLCLAASMFAVACSTEDISKSKNENNTDEKELTTFQSDDTPTSRTSMTHTLNGPGKFTWTVGDNLFVDNGGTLISSTSSNITSSMSAASFYFSGSGLTATSYPVAYTGKGATKGDEVTISATQTQTAPNDFSHLGTSGDCGTATAIRNANGIYKFQLEHKAAYLCFLPRTRNDVFKLCKLTKIELFADNTIAGTYAFSAAGLASAPTSGASDNITLTTGAAGFPLTNDDTSLETNAAYMVIAPGQHAFTIKYWITGTDGTTGTITKTIPSSTYAPNTITDLTANFDTNAFDSKYYMWDATADLWQGIETTQPRTVGQTAPTGLYFGTSDGRMWRQGGVSTPGFGPALNTASNCPNYAEISWYYQSGDPHWDNEEIWTVMGRLYKGGIWFLKKAEITGFSSTQDFWGNPYNHAYSYAVPDRDISPQQGKPAINTIGKYFYLPALGFYQVNNSSYDATLADVGTTGYYWSSTGHIHAATNGILKFSNTSVGTAFGQRWNASRLWTAN